MGGAVGRSRDTRFWRFPLPRFQSMQTHVVHHLYPTIPHSKEPQAFEAVCPYLVAIEVSNENDIPERVRFNPLVGSSPVREPAIERRPDGLEPSPASARTRSAVRSDR